MFDYVLILLQKLFTRFRYSRSCSWGIVGNVCVTGIISTVVEPKKKKKKKD